MDENKKNICLVTYNTVGYGQYPDFISTKDANIYLIQNETLWDLDVLVRTKGLFAGHPEDRVKVANYFIEKVLTPERLNKLDHIYLYIGNAGAENIIKKTKNMNENNITYVLCDCNLNIKKHIINNYGQPKAQVIMSECRGRRTLERILKNYIDDEEQPKYKRLGDEKIEELIKIFTK